MAHYEVISRIIWWSATVAALAVTVAFYACVPGTDADLSQCVRLFIFKGLGFVYVGAVAVAAVIAGVYVVSEFCGICKQATTPNAQPDIAV